MQNDTYPQKPPVKTTNKIDFYKKHSFLDNILPPYALVVTSDVSDAALLRAGASLQKHLAKVSELGRIQTQTQIQIWVPHGCLLGAC